MSEPPRPPERIDLAQADDRRDVVHRAVACLAQGEIVGLATETVYGLVASALHPQAVSRLRQIRGLDQERPLTLLLKGPVEVTDWVPDITELGWRLARRAWPGPVTLIFPSAGHHGLANRLPESVRALIIPNGQIALRSPSHPFVRDILRFLPVPLVLAKAPASDPRGATSAEMVADLSEVAMLIDAGQTQLSGVSTKVRVEGDRWSIERPGVVDAPTLNRMAGTIVVFVCTGNTCRSPIAEAICKMLLAKRLRCAIDRIEEHGYVVLSAGMAASNGMPAAAHAVEVVRARGGSLQHHQSRQLTPEIVRAADHIVTMTNDHLDALLDQAPDCAPRARLLHPQGADVDDPVGSDRETYQRTAKAIEEYLVQFLDTLNV